MKPTSYVLVSGGAGGIGAAICRLLPGSGFLPIIGYHSNRGHADALARECGGIAVELDLANDASIAQALVQTATLIGEEGVLHGVVLAASPPPELLPFGKLTSEILLHQFRVNVVGHQILLAGLIKTFFRKNKSGVVVGILSEAMGGAGSAPVTGMGAYVIAKIALRGMLSVCASEYPWLRVHTVNPGFTKTKMLDVFDERYLEQMQANKPFASAEDVAYQVLNKLVS